MTDLLEPRFVDAVPDMIEDGVLYVSAPFRTTAHLCACGCRNEVWMPLRPDRHHVTFDGETVTVVGSVGNWDFPCRSHYWIRRGRIVWAGDDDRSLWQRALSVVRQFFRWQRRP